MNINVSPELGRFLIDFAQHLFGVLLLAGLVDYLTRRKIERVRYADIKSKPGQELDCWPYK